MQTSHQIAKLNPITFNEPNKFSPFTLHPSICKLPKMSRREKIEAMLADDPSDTFLRYSLAMELRTEGEHEASLKIFDGLMQSDPPHVQAFFMSGQLLSEIDRVDEAREKLRDGIDQARAQGDAHAAAEMSELLASLGQYG